jgi:PEP-CTERM motif
MKRSLAFFVTTVLLTLGLSFSTAHADSITLTLTNATLSVVPGGTVTFSATVAADPGNGAAVFLNGSSTDGLDPLLSVDGSDVFNFPASLDPGDSFTGELFTVTLDPSATVGQSYSGIFILQGGVDDQDQTTLASPGFTVNAISAASAVPEPSSFALLGTGLAGVFATFKRKGVCQE